ncbi:MAG: class I SAM-dependent methyltransferase [Streptosporangiaceae bacterium]
MTDPYRTGVHRWWHLDSPSPELLAAEAAGDLGPPGLAVDLGCGLGTEAGYLSGRGWRCLGLDLSGPALRQASAARPDAVFARGDVTALPVRTGAADLLLDRGCFHYLDAPGRARYAGQAARVLRPGGRLLLRMCLNSAGLPNGLTEETIRAEFAGWEIVSLRPADLVTGTRTMPALQALLVRPGRR